MFHLGSFTNTQNAGVKPKIVASTSGSGEQVSPVLINSVVATMPPGHSPVVPSASVTEGNWAVARFDFKDPANLTGPNVELKDSATLKLAWDGASADDVDSSGLQVRFLDASGSINPYATVYALFNPSTREISFTDVYSTDPNVGTGAYGFVVYLATQVDAKQENGEAIHFKVTQPSTTTFVDSTYVEKRIELVDRVFEKSTTVSGSTGQNSGYASSQEVFVLPPDSVVSNGTAYPWTYATIYSFGMEDALRVDMAPSGGVKPGLSMVNFGVLTDPVVDTQPELINGLRALDGLDCNQGGLYIMGLQTSPTTVDTYIIFDSNNNGRLDTDGAGSDDVFVQLQGISPHALQSKHFDLI